VNPLHSVGARLSLALLVVVAGALGIVYVGVVPSLERRQESAKLSQLRRVAPLLRRQFVANPFDADFMANASATANARVVFYQPLTIRPLALIVGDDTGVDSSEVTKDPTALRASLDLRTEHGIVARKGERYAEVAFPVDEGGSVILLSSSLHDVLGGVHLVERRLLLAGVIALAGALLVGYAAARLFAARIRRLERAADRIARGQFDEPIADTGSDELGELARAFERMRGRLAQLDDARREFIANASHELRTPLFSLGGFIELLTDEELDESTRREFLETMREQVERLTRLATDLLDLSRLDAGRVRIDLRPLDLADVAAALADEFRARAGSGRHPLEAIVDREALALGDEERVLQIGRALVENALRHTPPGTPVRIRAGTRDGRAELAVEDEGPGIPPGDAEQVFERFYRVDGALASGSGLGLAIARELAELMDGRIRLERDAARTVFTLELARAAEPAPAFSRENAPKAIA
jgi:signal transduction histidine kinase